MFLLFYMVINSMPINKYDRKNSHGEDLKNGLENPCPGEQILSDYLCNAA